MVDYFSRTFGPFPFERLSHVESTTRYGGMENSTAIFYPEKAYAGKKVSEGTVAHETAHQWFGDAVTEADLAPRLAVGGVCHLSLGALGGPRRRRHRLSPDDAGSR